LRVVVLHAVDDEVQRSERGARGSVVGNLHPVT
jgi:hypothetical protein